ncbi:uncharacterized protein [Mytilus edulis]|uniref:uncharacterized protein n=1 Tax=Mytilus edulis TaxID=6550 RepID=UPI0039F0077F
MAERSRSKKNVRSSRIKVSPRVQCSKGRRRIVHSDEEDIHSSEDLVKTFREPISDESETYVKRSESDETSVGYVIRNSYQDNQPIGYVMKDQVVDQNALPEYVLQSPSTRNVRCQMTTHYVIQPQPEQRKPLRNEQRIRCVTKKQADEEKAVRRQEYINFQQEYVSYSPETRNVSCQMTTHFVILSHSKHNEQTQTQPEEVVPQPDKPSSRNSTPPTLLPPRDKSPDNIEIININNFKSLYPKSPDESKKYINSTPTTDTAEPHKPKDQFEYCIDLRPHVEILEKKSRTIDKDRIEPQPKKKIDDDIVTVGGGWNTMDDYMERHDPVQGFVYKREHLKNSDLPENRKKFYGFKSIYKYPQYKSAYHFYKSKCFFKILDK